MNWRLKNEGKLSNVRSGTTKNCLSTVRIGLTARYISPYVLKYLLLWTIFKVPDTCVVRR